MNKLIPLVVFSILLLVPSMVLDSFAIPVVSGGQYIEATTCDDHTPLPLLTHELGTGVFPPDELIISFDRETSPAFHTSGCRDGTPPGVPTGVFTQNILVSITNQGTKHWTDLFYVVDIFFSSTFVGLLNPDGTITDSTSRNQAFKIDNVGVNRPLLSESMNNDLIFEPGETWEFVIEGPHLTTNFVFLPFAGLLGSVGHGFDSSGNPQAGSGGSILANEHIPDPCILEPTLPECNKIIGGEIISIEATSLLLTGAQSFSWMIPVTLSILGIGIFVSSRKSEN